MLHTDWNNFYAGWGGFLWFGIVLLVFSSAGNWGYTYRAHRKYERGFARKEAMDILNERYARGEIKLDEYNQIRTVIFRNTQESPKKIA